MGHKRWTESDINYLKDNLGYRKILDIANKLNRSETAIMDKAKRLNLGDTRSISGRITSGELARILGVDRNTLVGWIKNHDLPATQKVTSIKKRYLLISPEEFWEWASKNKDKIDFRLLERNDFPPEPQWVEDERSNPSFEGKRYQRWTTHEDFLLAKLIDEGLSYEEISQKLNRTRFSVERRYHRIRQESDYYQGKKEYAIKKGNRLSMRTKKND